MIADLHCHTTASDGALAPQELLLAARSAGIDLLAITDHDTLAGYLELCAGGKDASVGMSPWLLPGVEFSSQWRGRQVHIVGLGVAPRCAVIATAVERQRTARLLRAERIARALERALGLSDVLVEVNRIAAGQAVSRPHFARFLVESGVVPSETRAFDRFLGRGKLGDISSEWPALDEVIAWIRAAGGVAVLAHPEGYGQTRSGLNRLVADFLAAGGQALELVDPRQHPNEGAVVIDNCRRLGLAASVGSDFHGPGQGWRCLGRTPTLPADLLPVWELAELARALPDVAASLP